ncbi:hypothetical protein C7S16_7176 [Burkholderia thailandensis]|uniref:Uncharacterized protein n=1 Tax=Burkholderia thailandensis TaxID=57975 RepID=A0AAW9CP90_BURTH|nr:hypothetical protein [Burkholderia thailandensis]MDW9251616.1 hypothetical protein [Burkholderia thailandensis]
MMRDASIFRYIDIGRTSESARKPIRRRVRGNIGHLDSSGPNPNRTSKASADRDRRAAAARPPGMRGVRPAPPTSPPSRAR